MSVLILMENANTIVLTQLVAITVHAMMTILLMKTITIAVVSNTYFIHSKIYARIV